MRKALALLALAGTLALAGCGAEGIARGVRVGAGVAAQEFADDARAGGLSESDGARLAAWAEEVGAAGGCLERTAAGWGGMSRAQKSAAVADFVAETAAAQQRLDAQGAPVFKSERARRRYAEVTKKIRQAVRLLAPPSQGS